MAERDGLVFAIDGESGRPRRLAPTSLADAGMRERRDLQEWLKADPEIIAPGLLLVAEEYDGWSSPAARVRDRLDLLFLDQTGSLVLCELKRDEAWDATDMQALKYAAYCNTITLEDVIRLYAGTHGVDEVAASRAVADHVEDIATTGLGPIRIRLVAGSFPASVTATVLFLREFDLDIGCVEVAARRLAVGQLILTSRLLIPLPQAEGYMVGMRKREQAEREQLQRQRTPNAVPVLLDAAAIAPGTEVRFRLEQLSSKQRALVEPFLEAHPDAGVAEWTGISPGRALRWRYNDEERSASGLAVRLVREAGEERDLSLPGPSCWQLADGRTLFELSQEVTAASTP
mgnify:CR=1 FL=1